MANTRGPRHVHGPSSTGTISAGSVSTAPAPGVHGSGATAGSRTTVAPGTKGTGSGSPISGGTGSRVNAGSKTTVTTPGKRATPGGGNGVGSGTPVRRKRAPRLGT